MWAVHEAEVLQSMHELLDLAGVTTLPEVVCLFVLPSSRLSVCPYVCMSNVDAKCDFAEIPIDS